jgi:hypothetical protein
VRRCPDRPACSWKVYAGVPHGITDTHREQLGADLLESLNPTKERAADESCHVHT